MKWEFRTEKCNTKAKNLMDRLNSEWRRQAERTRELEDRIIELPIVSSREKIDWREFFKSFQDLWDYNKRSKICVIGVLEGEERIGL